jgi:hypothetical protein
MLGLNVCDALCALQIEDSFEAQEGAQLSEKFKIGKHLGSGSAADVYKLEYVEGDKEPTHKVGRNLCLRL